MQMSKLTKYLLAFGMCLEAAWPAARAQNPRVIEVHARRYAFSPSTISVKKGQPVELKLFSDDVAHSLMVKDLGINQVATRNKPADVTFTPSRAGTFSGKCGHFCGEGHGRMSFTIQVTEN
jgi:cytochrome c oxidase subunit 2